jgi:competence protein ComEC
MVWKQGLFFSVSLAVIGGFLAAAYLPSFFIAIFCAIAAALFLVLKKGWGGKALFLTMACSLAYFYFLYVDGLHRSSLTEAAKAGETLYMDGVIDSPVIRDGDIARFMLMGKQIGHSLDSLVPLPRQERIAMRVALTEQSQINLVEKWTIGQRWQGAVRLALPERARNPHAFDYARYLRWRGIHVTGSASFPDIWVDPGEGSLASVFLHWQMAAGKKVEELFPEPEMAGYMKSLLLGMQTEVSPELREVYANLGALHVLAISGLHITIISGMTLWIGERCGVSRKTGLLMTIAVISLYVLLAGAGASAVRAGMMGGLGLLAQYHARRVEVRELWAVTLLLMLLFDPYQLWQIGFQLSFAVTLGLIEFVPLLSSLPYPRMKAVRSFLAVTVSAQLVSFPFLIYWFHQFSPLSALVNLIVVPLLSVIVLPLGLMALLAGTIHPAFGVLPAYGAECLLDGIHQVFGWLDRLQPPFRHWIHPEGIWLFFYALFLSASIFLWKMGYHRRRDLIMYGLLLALLVGLARQPFSGADEVRITFLDVGQGDSIVVEVGKEKVYLIDGGGTLRFGHEEAWRKRRDPFEVGKDILLPFLRSRGIEHIDCLIMTHGDADHVGGLPAILPYFSFGVVVVNGKPPQGTEQEVINALRKRNVPIITGKPGVSWLDTPDVRWTWLHPGPSDGMAGNDASVVLLLSAFGRNILFTGDLEKDGEAVLLQHELPDVDVLKVGHHGSQTSTTPGLLVRIKPESAVISAGRHNRYGHPSTVVLQRLSDAGVNVYRTDQQGAVTLVVRPEKMIWKTQILVQDTLQLF